MVAAGATAGGKIAIIAAVRAWGKIFGAVAVGAVTVRAWGKIVGAVAPSHSRIRGGDRLNRRSRSQSRGDDRMNCHSRIRGGDRMDSRSRSRSKRGDHMCRRTNSHSPSMGEDIFVGLVF